MGAESMLLQQLLRALHYANVIFKGLKQKNDYKYIALEATVKRFLTQGDSQLHYCLFFFSFTFLKLEQNMSKGI